MNPPLTIVGVFPSPEVRTGGHRRFLELMRGLEARGNTVHLAHDPAVRGVEKPLPGNSLSIFRSGKLSRKLLPAWWRYLSAAKRAGDRVKVATAGSPSVVVAFSTTDYFAARRLADDLGAPLLFAFRSNIVTIHRRFGMLYKESKYFKGIQRFVQGHWKRFQEWKITHGADRVVFQSDYDRDEVVSRNPDTAGYSVIIPNSMRASWFPPELALTNDSRECRRLLYLGSVGERKGIRHIIPAMRELCKDRGLPVSLDVVGSGTLLPWATEYVRREGLEECVNFLGKDNAPLGRLAEADLLVVPSLYDSFPNTVLEALYVGTPVVGSDTSGIRAILRHEELLFDPENPSAIADLLEPIIQDSGRYQQIRELCSSRRDVFDFDWYGRFEEVIHELAEEHYGTVTR